MDASLLMNIATILFFLASFPQLRRTYQNRKNLKDLSLLNFLLAWTGCTLMGVVGFLIQAWITVAIEFWHVFYNGATLYWLIKYRKKSK